INDEIARRFGVLFSAGEVDAGGAVAQSIVDSSEIINTLGGGGISTVGYASESLEGEQQEGLLSRFSDDEPSFADSTGGVNRIASLVRKAALGRLTLPANISSTERALVVVAGPPEHLTRKGIERARKWIEDETGCLEVRGGDYPLPNETQLAAVVLLSGVTDVPRIEAMQQVAVDAKESMEKQQAQRESKVDEMTDDRLDSLF
ncbi:MAG: cell division protein, partial [Halobacteriales archaeon]|nr:cell division protein [Halobacteriales archaeon]